jgi:hypothetical protein
MFKNTIKTTQIIIIFTIAVITGCSSNTRPTDTRPASLDHIKLERIDSSSAGIIHAYLKFSDDQLVLRGEIKRKLHQRGTVPGHLNVEVIDTAGTVIDDTAVCYKLKCTNTGTSSFIYKTSRDPQEISVIRITHHNDHSHSR